ncbi:MAG: DUF1127 domain-containing protein [Marinovum sp.]|nr:DUF1127 domain-containing protein [Marinovum sp.]
MAHIVHSARVVQNRSFPSISAILGLIRQRQDLARLDDAQLRDLGLTRQEAQDEASRPAWDVPNHWVR